MKLKKMINTDDEQENINNPNKISNKEEEINYEINDKDEINFNLKMTKKKKKHVKNK